METDLLREKLNDFELKLKNEVDQEFIELINNSTDEELIYYMLLCKKQAGLINPERILYFLNCEINRRTEISNESKFKSNRNMAILALCLSSVSIVATILIAIFKN